MASAGPSPAGWRKTAPSVILNGVRDEAGLKARAEELADTYKIEARPVLADVSEDTGVQTLVKAAHSGFPAARHHGQ